MDESDIAYAAEHIVRAKTLRQRDGTTLVKFTGRHPDPLMSIIEVAMSVRADGLVTVFHANAETDNFFDRS